MNLAHSLCSLRLLHAFTHPYAQPLSLPTLSSQQLFDLVLDEGRCEPRSFVLLCEAGAPSLLVDPPSGVDFGVCQRDRRVTKTLTLRNVGSFPLSVRCHIRSSSSSSSSSPSPPSSSSSSTLSTASVSSEVAPPPPPLVKVLPPLLKIAVGAAETVELQFLPTHEAPVAYSFVCGWMGPSISVPVTGQGGSARLRLRLPPPDDLHFARADRRQTTAIIPSHFEGKEGESRDGPESGNGTIAVLDAGVCIVGADKACRVRLHNDGSLAAHYQARGQMRR